jgi:NAD(P)-dependent dehydrogenase (short-subunit alcohol dehydrogenase family)
MNFHTAFNVDRGIAMTQGATPGDLTGKVIVVTGGAQGIGGAAARLCAERGGTVVIADWQPAKGSRTAANLHEVGLDATFVQTDVRSPESVMRLMAEVQAQFGRLDVLVCAAGIFKGAFQPPDELTVEDFDDVIDVNLKGVFLCTKFAMPLFDARGNGGTIIIVGSPAGVVGASGSLAYGASKGGVNGYGMTLARHIAKREVRVNVICPGGINTELKLGVVRADAQRQGKAVDAAVSEAMQDLGNPEGVGRVIAFLASDDAAYVRGTLYTR